MINNPTAAQAADMVQAGFQFVEQFEMQRVLAAFENELLILASENPPQTREPEQSSPAG